MTITHDAQDLTEHFLGEMAWQKLLGGVRVAETLWWMRLETFLGEGCQRICGVPVATKCWRLGYLKTN